VLEIRRSGSGLRRRSWMGVFQGMTKYLGQSLDLVALPNFDEVFWHGPFQSTDHRPEISDDHQASTDYIWRTLHPQQAAEHFEAGMAAEQIILSPEVQQPAENLRVLLSAHIAVMEAVSFFEPLRLPTLGLCGQYCNEIDAPHLNWRIATDLLPAAATEELAGAGHVVGALESLVLFLVVLEIGRSRDTQLWIIRELAYQKLQVVAFESNIRIQVSDDLVVEVRKF